MSRPSPRVVPHLAAAALAALVTVGVIGCAPNGAGLADADAVREVAALDGEPLPIHEWTTDLAAARAQAAAQGKDVLVLYTGSEWCHYCQLLEKEVFAQSPASRLTDEVVPVALDFHPDGTPVQTDPALAAAHTAAINAADIDGFPTVVLTDAAGTAFATMNYEQRYSSGGAAAFLADVKALRAKHGRPGGGAEPSVGGTKTAGL